jgi:hypothetical protein
MMCFVKGLHTIAKQIQTNQIDGAEAAKYVELVIGDR